MSAVIPWRDDCTRPPDDLCAVCHREGCTDHPIVTRLPRSDASADDGAFSDSIEDFLAVAPTVAPPLVAGLIPGAGIGLWNGQPRARKSLVTLEALLSLAAGVAPFGLARLNVPHPVPCWYVTEEDHAGEVAARIRALLAGRNASAPPAFRLSVYKGVSLDDAPTIDRLIDEAQRHRIRVIALDPIRSVSCAVDKGPGELGPLTRTLRRIMRETDATIILPHHDTKPRADGKPDDRPRAQRASGGGILSISEAPCHFERVNDTSTLIVPNHWKFSSDPPPLKVSLELSGPGCMRLVAEDVEASAANDLALHERILAVLAEQGGGSTKRIATTVRARKEDVTHALEQLALAGKVDSVKAGNANRWFLKAA